MNAYSARYDEALIMAARAHDGQKRKGTDIPYLIHVVSVSVILLRYGFDETLQIAGLLHDVIEDCAITRETIAAAFGEEVARLVVAVSKPMRGMPLDEAHQALLDLLAQSDERVAALKAADALHNVQSIVRDWRRDGAIIWQRFRRGAEPTLVYYQRVVHIVRQHLQQHPLVDELDRAVNELAQLTASLAQP